MAAPQGFCAGSVAVAVPRPLRSCPAATKPLLSSLLVLLPRLQPLSNPPPGFGQRLVQPLGHVRALHLAARKHGAETRERGLPIFQAEWQKDGGHDGEAQTASLEEAPSPHLQESPKGGSGATRGEGLRSPPSPGEARGLGSQSLVRAQGLPPSASVGGGGGAVPAGGGQKEESHHSLRVGEIRYLRLKGSFP